MNERRLTKMNELSSTNVLEPECEILNQNPIDDTTSIVDRDRNVTDDVFDDD